MIPALLFVAVLTLYFVCTGLLRRAVRQEERRGAAVCRWERLASRSLCRAKWREQFTTAGLVLRHLKSKELKIE